MFGLVLTEHEGIPVVDVRGDVDIANAERLRVTIIKASRPAPAPRVVVDLSQCPYLDSSGLAALLRSYKWLGDEFPIIVPAESSIRRLMQVAKLDDVLWLLEDRDAIAATGSRRAPPR